LFLSPIAFRILFVILAHLYPLGVLHFQLALTRIIASVSKLESTRGYVIPPTISNTIINHRRRFITPKGSANTK